MKAILSILLLSLLSVSAYARTENVKIIDVLPPEGEDKDYIVLASNGNVYSIDADNDELISEAQRAREEAIYVEAQLGIGSNIANRMGRRARLVDIERSTRTETTASETIYTLNSIEELTPLSNYEVTELSDMQQAKRYFDTMTSATHKRSQCFNRSHWWTYRLTREYGLNPGKIWLFFTRTYIRDYNYKWWFHTAPYFKVNGQPEIVIFDREFDDEPKLKTAWKNDYIHSERECPEVTRYSQYVAGNHGVNHCYIMKSSKYFLQPDDLENLEEQGVLPTRYDSAQVNGACRDALTRRARRNHCK